MTKTIHAPKECWVSPIHSWLSQPLYEWSTIICLLHDIPPQNVSMFTAAFAIVIQLLIWPHAPMILTMCLLPFENTVNSAFCYILPQSCMEHSSDKSGLDLDPSSHEKLVFAFHVMTSVKICHTLAISRWHLSDMSVAGMALACIPVVPVVWTGICISIGWAYYEMDTTILQMKQSFQKFAFTKWICNFIVTQLWMFMLIDECIN